MEKFTHLSNFIIGNECIAEESSAKIAKTQAVFPKLYHLWGRVDVSLTMKDRVHNVIVYPTIPYECRTLALRSEDEYYA